MKLTLHFIKNHLIHTLFLTLITLFSCVKEKVEPVNGIDGLDGFNALVDIQSEPAGDNCSSGGLKISVGQDSNENAILDESEVESINYICNGSSGTDGQTPSNLLAKTSAEQPGENCEFGGTLIEIGNDNNNNGILDNSEIVSSFFICNGSDGSDGSNGSDGSDGSDGLNGYSSIIRATAESAGDNCTSGGLKIEIGLDSNDNQELDIEEIQSTYFVCNGTNGSDGVDGSDGSNGLSTLSNIISEPAGENCANGGYKIEIGLDSNNNGSLDAGEVSSENYICNGNDGADGNNGFSSLIRISTELPSANCSDGGMKVEVGLDDITINGTLDDDEVDFTQYVCDGLNGGENGLNSIIQTTTEAPGGNCSNGGVQIQVGLDANSNNEIDAGEEVGSPFYVCNGIDGVDGSNGSDGKDVIVISSPSASCANGGSNLEFGYDGNNDGDLADDEDTILTTITICNGIDGSDGADGTNGSDGVDGFNTIIVATQEDAGENCTNGGLAFTVGLDINRNNAIDAGEEIDTYYVCNGADGSDGAAGANGRDVIVTSSAAASCSNGGVTLEFGYDGNGDGDLSDLEDTVLSSTTICNGTDGENGADGYNTIIEANTVEAGEDCSDGGMAFKIGLDTNRNNVIDVDEEIDTYYVCNGADGSDGADGANGRDVIVTSSAAASCANGGITLEFGYDGNNDGDLSDIEDTVLSSTTICNGTNGNDGTDGYNTIIATTAEAPSVNCSNGGTKFTVGLDTNRNNEIDEGEEVGTYYVCDGNDGSSGNNGSNSLIDITSFSNSQGGCADGGLKIDTGIDTNNDGILQSGEILSTAYVCNGSDGTDGSDGNSDGVFEFYFQEGLDGYSGSVDISLTNKNGNENGETFSVDKGTVDSHALLYFPGVEKMENTIGTTEFEIVEAVLYLKGQSTRLDGVNSDNWIGVKTLQPDITLFKEDAVTWNTIDGSVAWTEPGVTTNDSDGDALGYSDMYRLPNSIVFNGYIPLLLNKSEVNNWRDLGKNKGLVLLMADVVPYQLDIIASENTKNESERPTLYIKAKVNTRGRSETISHRQQKMIWDQMSYQEKLAPLRRK